MRFSYLRGAQAIKADLDYLRGSLRQWIIVMAHAATEAEINAVVDRVHEIG